MLTQDTTRGGHFGPSGPRAFLGPGWFAAPFDLGVVTGPLVGPGGFRAQNFPGCARAPVGVGISARGDFRAHVGPVLVCTFCCVVLLSRRI